VAQPKTGGTLKWGIVGDFVRMEGHYIGPTMGPLHNIWDRLVELDEDLKPTPMLAESWDVSPDAKQIKFNLRKGVTFHSGREFGAEDIKANVLRAQDLKIGVGQLVNMSSWFKEFEIADKNTIVLKSDGSRPAMFDLFDYMNIVDPQNADPANNVVQGTGPFKFVQRRPGIDASLTKNPNYWQSGKPYLNELAITWFADPQVMLTNLETGTVDLVDRPSIPDIVRLQKDPKYTLLRQLTSGTHTMGFNTKVGPTANKKFRQAVSLATDRKRFAETVLLGLGTPQVQPWSAKSPAFDKAINDGYVFDLDKAKAALAESGLTNPETDIMFGNTGAVPQHEALAQILQQDLAKIGIKGNVRKVEAAFQNQASKDLAFSFINLNTGSFANLEPSTMFLMSANWSPIDNNTGFTEPEYAQKVYAMGGEPDAAKRKAMYDDMNKYMLDQVWNPSVASQAAYSAFKSEVKGVRYTQASSLGQAFKEVWLDR
jgi:peptide/nickel transport system substrate-binding protein